MEALRKQNEKLKEISKLKDYRISHFEAGNNRGHGVYKFRINTLESEISALDKQIESDSETMRKELDDAYLKGFETGRFNQSEDQSLPKEPTPLRDELIKFAIYMVNNLKRGDTPIWLVDEYLNSKEK